MSLPIEDMASVSAAVTERDLMPLANSVLVTPPPAEMAKLQCLHAAAVQLAEDAPAVIAHPEAARGLEQALIEALIGCLSIGEVRENRLAQRHHLGISPKRYLMLRRMHFARRALRDGSPGTTTVTEIAAQYGFWQFGRFAGEYKSLFGEAPSATSIARANSDRAPRTPFGISAESE
jgi:hypothetical protein